MHPRAGLRTHLIDPKRGSNILLVISGLEDAGKKSSEIAQEIASGLIVELSGCLDAPW